MKYRPYLTLPQIEYILMRIADHQDPEAIQIRLALQPLLFKASVGAVKGSYQPTPRKDLKDKLGFTYQDEREAKYLNGEMTPEEEAEYEASLMKGN